MPNKILATLFAIPAFWFGAASFAQAPGAEPANKSPNMSPADTVTPPDTPAERVAPKAGTGRGAVRPSHQSKHRHKTAPKKVEPKSDGIPTPASGTSSRSAPGGQ